MDRGALALYEWAIGACFRCAREAVPTTRIDGIDTPIGDHYEIRACERCVTDMEEERHRHALRVGGEYAPGRL